MTPTEAHRLAAAINQLRPDWAVASIDGFIRARLAERAYRDAAVALAWVATDPTSQTPARVLEAGPWWRATMAETGSAIAPPVMCELHPDVRASRCDVDGPCMQAVVAGEVAVAPLAAKVRAQYVPRPRPVAQREPTPRDLDDVRKRIDKEASARLLGAADKPNGRPGRVPTERWAQTLIGFSTDEADRALRIQNVGYSQASFPLLELGMSRTDCRRYLTKRGFGDTQKSSCIGCPYRANKSWRRMRDTAPADFADAVAFDEAMRHGSARANAQGQPLRGEMFLHRSLLPLSVAPIDRVTAREWAERQGDILELALQMYDESEDCDEAPGCSPWGCAS